MNINKTDPVNGSTQLSDYYYELPRHFIAQKPMEKRENSRLLVLDKKTGEINHHTFNEIAKYMKEGDLLILNNTKVLPARVVGYKLHGAFVELLFIEEIGKMTWKALLKSNAKLREGEQIYLNNKNISVNLLEKHRDGSWTVEPSGTENIKELLNNFGEMPLPPYIKRPKKNNTRSSDDRERYQTVFAQKEGAIAAPTAGLHFSKTLLEMIGKKGIDIEYITLHAGLGTFLPVKTADIRDHCMHKEAYELPERILQKIKHTKAQKKRVIAVGSTTCRVLETIASQGERPQFSGWTDLFIYPSYEFKYVDVLITNFHLPKTTLLMLVSAFAGRERILNAYEIAKSNNYRFFSYGDCMMVL